jgi:hypothetical protein
MRQQPREQTSEIAQDTAFYEPRRLGNWAKRMQDRWVVLFQNQ